MSASRSRRLPACRLWSTGLTVVLLLGGGCRDRSPVSGAGPVALPAVPSPLPPGPDKPASPAPTFPAGPRQGPLKVVRRGDREYLDRHGERLLICDYVRPWYDLNQRSDIVLAGGYRVIYRPHPLSGTHSPGYGRADREIRAILGRANSSAAASRD